MNTKVSLTSIALLGLLALVPGCGQAATGPAGSSSGQTVLLTKADAPSIQVQGRGESTASTDTGYFDVGVEVTAPSVATARQRAAAGAARVIAALEKNGVAKKDIQTSAVNVNPTYGQMDGRITGYSVFTSVNVVVRNLDSMGKLIDDATLAGGDAARVNGIRFGIENSEGLRAQAREKAVADAKKRAEQLAQLSGVKLGAPLAIEEVAVNNFMPMPMGGEAADATARMPIERGSGTIAVEVKVRWSIQG
jgi:uncharacterized protein YggE